VPYDAITGLDRTSSHVDDPTDEPFSIIDVIHMNPRELEMQEKPSATIVPVVLYDDIVRGQCVIFVGAGVTTEGDGPYSKPTFYETIRQKANHPDADPLPSFPDLMEYFCNRVDGGLRNRLIREAIDRIEYFSVPGEARDEATIFPDVLAQIPYFGCVVTTNWDPFLERSMGILVPVVEDRDLVFWDGRKRQILKIHGCITRPDTLVATRADYDACMLRNPLVFNKLKDLIATKTFIFVGYSMRDSDFQSVLDEVVCALGPLRRLAYVVNPSATPERIHQWKIAGIETLRGTGLIFLRDVRTRLEQQDLIPSQRFLACLRREERRIRKLHFDLNQNEEGGMASAMYQDGLLHALNDVLTHVELGRQHQEFQRELGDWEGKLGRMRKERDIIEIAYVSGWCEVYRRFCQRAETAIPPFFHPYNLLPLHDYVKG
jgi:hypothetical protein